MTGGARTVVFGPSHDPKTLGQVRVTFHEIAYDRFRHRGISTRSLLGQNMYILEVCLSANYPTIFVELIAQEFGVGYELKDK